MFGFHSQKYDLKLIKPFLTAFRVNERDIEPTAIKEANQFNTFNIDDIQPLHIMNFLVIAKSLESFFKAYKTSETKKILPLQIV